MLSKELLPPNSTPLERNMADTVARISNVPSLPVLWDPDRCPEALLPWLAWALSVEEWDSSWPSSVQREAIKLARVLHKRKGTIGSVKLALQSLGYGDATILEGLDAEVYDGTVSYDGTFFYGNETSHWAKYRVYLSRPITVEQANHVRRILAAYTPARSKLESLSYDGVDNIYDGVISYNGTGTYGAL